jgi:hypothetical protein
MPSQSDLVVVSGLAELFGVLMALWASGALAWSA